MIKFILCDKFKYAQMGQSPSIPGPAGRGISGTSIDAKGVLTITFTDGTTQQVQIPLPSNGVGVKSAAVDAAGNLTVTLTDSSVLGPFNVKGSTGAQGVPGLNGTGILQNQLMYFANPNLGVSPAGVSLTNGVQNQANATQVEISNDTNTYKAMVLAGNTSDSSKNGKRQIKMYDDVYIDNNMSVNGMTSVKGAFTVTGTSQYTGGATFAGGAVINGGVAITGGTVSDKLTVSGDANFAGNTTFTSNSTNAHNFIASNTVTGGASVNTNTLCHTDGTNCVSLDDVIRAAKAISTNSSGDLLLNNPGGKQWNFGGNGALYAPNDINTAGSFNAVYDVNPQRAINIGKWNINGGGDLQFKSSGTNNPQYNLAGNQPVADGNTWIAKTHNYSTFF